MATRYCSNVRYKATSSCFYGPRCNKSTLPSPGSRHHSTLSTKIGSRSGLRHPRILIQVRLSQSSPVKSRTSTLGSSIVTNPQGWRSLACWTRHARSIHSNKRMRGEEAGDWYGRWERHKRRQYEALRRHVEENPYDALFGASNRWLGWLNYSTISSARRAKTHGEQLESAFASRQETTASPMSQLRTHLNQGESVHAAEQAQEYEIDPITLRKVPVPIKREAPRTSSAAEALDAVDIPVKKFEQAKVDEPVKKGIWSLSTHVSQPAGSSPKGWLTMEGFGHKAVATKAESRASEPRRLKTFGRASIESALDRHIKNVPKQDQMPPEELRTIPTWTPQDSMQASKVSHETKESSDQPFKGFAQVSDGMHSSSGSVGPGGLKTDHDALRPRDQTKDNISKSPDQADLLPEKILPKWRSPTPSTSILTSSQVARLRSKLVPLKAQIDTLKDSYTSLQHQILQEKRRIQLNEERRAARRSRMKLDSSLKEEVEKQKDAMAAIETRGKDRTTSEIPKASPDAELRGEGDIASNVHEFVDRARWYKRKAPHAKCEMDAKLQRLAKERAFVKEIRGIYEGKYGTIDCSHRQPAGVVEQSEERIERDLGKVHKDSTAPTPDSTTRGIGALELFVASELRDAQATTQLRSLAASIDESIRELRQNDNQRLSEKISSLKTKIKSLLEEVNSMNTVPSASASNTHTAAANPLSSVYRILAYDHSTQRVTSAKTESSTPLTNDGLDGKEPSLAMHQVLTKLYNPGKFLPHLHALQNRGFDVVSVTGDVVMLKKVREPTISRDDLQGRPNPIDGTTTPEVSAGNFASPTGFVNYGPVIPPEEQQRSEPATPRAEEKVKRQEDVFSGDSGRWHESKVSSRKLKRRARKWQTLRKMLFTGTVTGALCYAVGMIEENRLLQRSE